MSEKKRKAQKDLSGQPSKKKTLSVAPNATVRVRYLSSPDTAKPVIGTLVTSTVGRFLIVSDYVQLLLLGRCYPQVFRSSLSQNLSKMGQKYCFNLRTIPPSTSPLRKVVHMPPTTSNTMLPFMTRCQVNWTSRRQSG